jgi:hypothetical protein
MSTFPKEAIKEILQALDHKNDALWTDDGSPLVSEIQRLANDKTITRGQISDASPGFVRKTKDSVTEDVQPGDEPNLFDDAPGGGGVVVVEAKNTTIGPVSEVQTEDDGFEGDFETEEEEREYIKAIAQQRVRDAELALTDAKTHTAEAYRAERQAEQRLTRALQQYSAKFPPMSAAENIKQHHARQQELLRERVTGSRFEPNSALNPVDASLMDRKRNNGRNGKGPTPAPYLPRKAAVNY